MGWATPLGLLSGAASGCEPRPLAPIPSVELAPAPRRAPPLVLEQALPVEAPQRFQPSGLLFAGGRLLTVSDKHDRQLFELVLEGDRARAVAVRRFELPPGSRGRLDWEGLAAGAGGSLLLVSEAQHRVALLGPPGQQPESRWLTPSLRPLAQRVGCLSRRNAGLEGLAMLPDGRLLLAAERKPRGLLEWSWPRSLGDDTNGGRGRAWVWPSGALGPFGRRPDVGDLASSESGRVYALLRGEHTVVRIRSQAGGYREGEAWSFADTENEPRFRYQDMRYGRAEGLAFDERRVFIVLDNNGDARQLAPSDHRPLLFVFSRPMDLR